MRSSILALAFLVAASVVMVGCGSKSEPEDKDYYKGPISPRTKVSKTATPKPGPASNQ